MERGNFRPARLQNFIRRIEPKKNAIQARFGEDEVQAKPLKVWGKKDKDKRKSGPSTTIMKEKLSEPCALC